MQITPLQERVIWVGAAVLSFWGFTRIVSPQMVSVSHEMSVREAPPKVSFQLLINYEGETLFGKYKQKESPIYNSFDLFDEHGNICGGGCIHDRFLSLYYNGREHLIFDDSQNAHTNWKGKRAEVQHGQFLLENVVESSMK